MDKIYTLGIDIGSTASKCVILADGKELVSKSLIPVGAGTSGPQRAISDVLENAGLKREDRLRPQLHAGDRRPADERAELPRQRSQLPFS